jgi:hypothetical protein
MPRQRIIKFQTSPGKQPYLIIEQILDGFIKRVNYLSDKYSQISVCHMTISLPITPDTVAAKVVGICLTCLRKKLKYMGMESQCGWVKEISLNEGIWYNNYNSFINETNNWFIRGGIGTTQNNGIFYYNATTDTNSEYITTRIVLK